SFFFSGRRRHTRFKCDWSSDVCSSDLRFYWSDGLMSGRVSKGETWRFHSIDHELRLTVGRSLGYLERYRLVPAERDPRQRWLAGDRKSVVEGREAGVVRCGVGRETEAT